MIRRMRTAGLALLLAGAAFGAEFHNGQAARAVIGQPTFSARDSGVTAHALAISRGRLSAAEGEHVFTFDVTHLGLGGATSKGPCAVCGFAPVGVVIQPVMRGVASVASYGKTVVAVDTANHRVYVWKTGASNRPDVTLGKGNLSTAQGAATLAEPVSVAFDGHRLFVGDAALHRVLVWNSLPTVDDQAADAVLGQADFTASGASEIPGAATFKTPAALLSDGVNLFVADSENHRILVFTPGDFVLPGDAVVNAATLLPAPLAPGTLISIKTAGLRVVAEAASAVSTAEEPLLPTRLGDVEVTVNGVALPLLSVSAEEIQAQLPYELGDAKSGALTLQSFHENRVVASSAALAVAFAPASPGIFAVGTHEPRSGLALHAERVLERDGAAASGPPVTMESPAKSGEAITVWATGLGLLGAGDVQTAGAPAALDDNETLLPVKATVNGQSAAVVSARLPPGAIGVYEVRLIVPVGLPPGENARLQLSQDGVASNIVSLPLSQ